MGDIKLFAKKLKRNGNSNTDNANIYSGYRDRIWHGKMCHVNNEKRETTNDGRNRTSKRRKNQNAQRKYLGMLKADVIKQVEMKEKNEKSISQ